jgi:hypothetical protein
VDRETREAGIVVGGEKEWLGHLNSRIHKARVKRLKKQRDWEEWKVQQERKGHMDGITGEL